MGWIAEPWQTGLVARGGFALVLVGLSCGLIGAFVVMRGLTFAGESLAHAVLPGGIVAALVGVPIGWGAAGAVALAAIAVAAISRGPTDDDTALGIVFVGALGLAVLLISRGDGTQQTIESFLFGNALASTNGDLLLALLTALGVAVMLLVGWRALLASTFQSEGASALGIRSDAVAVALLAAIAAVVIAALQVVGSLLTLALLVTPAATARLITQRARNLVLLAGLLGMTAGVGGLYLSYFANVAAGGSVVLVSTAGLLVTLAASATLPRPSRQAAQVP